MKKDLKTLNRSLALAIAAAMTMTSAPAAAYAADVELADADITSEEDAAVEVEESTEDTEVQAEESEAPAAVEETADEESSSSDSSSEESYSAPSGSNGQAVVDYACQFVGNPYVWGGTSLTNGVDCSGFTMQILGKYGVSLPHSSSAQPGCGTIINSSDAQPGDLFFYGSGSSISHVAIYIGDGQIVHASNSRDGIKVSNAYYRTPICVARYF